MVLCARRPAPCIVTYPPRPFGRRGGAARGGRCAGQRAWCLALICRERYLAAGAPPWSAPTRPHVAPAPGRSAGGIQCAGCGHVACATMHSCRAAGRSCARPSALAVHECTCMNSFIQELCDSAPHQDQVNDCWAAIAMQPQCDARPVADVTPRLGSQVPCPVCVLPPPPGAAQGTGWQEHAHLSGARRPSTPRLPVGSPARPMMNLLACVGAG